MRPKRPASMAALSWRAASPKRAWKMDPTRTPAFSASGRMWSVPSTVESSGFSIMRCLPARMAASAGSRCSADGVVMHTASSPGCCEQRVRVIGRETDAVLAREILRRRLPAADHAHQPPAARGRHGARVEMRDGARADEAEA